MSCHRCSVASCRTSSAEGTAAGPVWADKRRQLQSNRTKIC